MDGSNESTDKIERVLGIYTKLINGYIVNKAEEANNYGVVNSVIFDRLEKGYRLEQT